MGLFSLEGSGILSQIISQFIGRGKAVLNASTATIIFKKGVNFANDKIINFTINLQFINHSLHQTFVTDFSAKFYDGIDWHDLSFSEEVLPASVLEAKSPTKLTYILVPPIDNMDVPYIALDGRAHLAIDYRISKRKHRAFIHEISTVQGPDFYSWVAM